MSGQAPENLAWAMALERLLAGNRRYVDGTMTHPRQSRSHREQLHGAQEPFATILGCADSRVPPEVVFDQGLGDLFAVRVAGNVVGECGLASLEYAVGKLGTPLILVLGHARCGAVAAATAGGDPDWHLSRLMIALRPAVDLARAQPGDLITNAVRANARLTAQKLRTAEPLLAQFVREGRLKVLAAYYHLDTGVVEIL